MGAPIIEIAGLTRFYGERRGVEGVTLSVADGALEGFLGPNGAGKTTTIRVLLGFLRPDSGRAMVFGRDCWSASAKIKAEVGYVPGDLRLYPWMDGRSALSIFGRVRGRDMLSAGRELAERFGLDLRVRVRAMSKGMRQKLGLILAMAHRPRLLVLDEPTAGLDPLMQEDLRAELKRLAGAGHTVFFSSHSLGEVESLCDRVAIVRDGRLVADEPLGTLRGRAGREVTIRWQAGRAPADVPAFLRLSQREPHRLRRAEVGGTEGDVWKGVLEGPVSDLIAWLAGKPVEDVSIAPPDLESLFHRFYERGQE